jgi:pimeloyl-ACP methyl ester carboxylesterase
MTRRLLALLVGVLVVLGSAVAVGSPAAAAPTCDTTNMGTRAPVLLVHGFRSAGGRWATDLYPRRKELPGAPGTYIAEPFDYSSQNTEWIQNNSKSTAATRLAERISCLAAASRANHGPGKVALVGHSLGGLVIRCALTTACSHGPDVTAVAGQIVTIGTPSLGSFWRPNGTASAVATAFGRAVEAACALIRAGSRLPSSVQGALTFADWIDRPFCDVLTALGSSSAGQAFTMNSRQLSALPPWPAGAQVRTIAASIRFVYQVLFWSASPGEVGDAVVGVDSALSRNPSRTAGGSTTISCGELRLTQLGAAAVPTALPSCHHDSEPKEADVRDAVAEVVGPWARSVPPAADPCSDDESFTIVADWADPGLNDDGYFDSYELLGCSDGYVVGVGHPVTETDNSYVVFQKRSGGWTKPRTYGVGIPCGEIDLPDDVEALLNCVPDQSTGGAYTRYTNPRFGFSCEVPSGFRAGEEPANGDGLQFTSQSGEGFMICSGANNVFAYSAEQGHADDIASAQAAGNSVEYENLDGSVSTVSGFDEDGDIYYRRTVWGEGSTNTLYWLYQSSAQAEYGPLVEHTARTFAPGPVAESR